MTKSETISLTYEIGKSTLIDLPKTYEHGSVIEGKVSLRSGSQFNNIDTVLSVNEYTPFEKYNFKQYLNEHKNHFQNVDKTKFNITSV